MKEVNSSMLSGAKAAEDALARKEVRDLADSIPEGHVLRDEIDRQTAEMGGDLSGLPPSHPLYRAMVAAKERFETEKAEEEAREEETQKAQERLKVKKAKKLDEKRARQNRIAKEVEREESLREATTAVDGEVVKLLDGVRALYGVIAEHEEILNTHPIGKMRLMRLKRFMYATERGLSTARMGRV